MVDQLAEVREQNKNMQLAAMLWWQIIWYASDEGRNEIPSQQEWLSCELVATIIETVTGTPVWFSWRHNEAGKEAPQQRGWQHRLNQALGECAVSEVSIHWKRPLELLMRFVQYEPYGGGEYSSTLEAFHENNALHNTNRCTFIPHQETYRRAQQYLSQGSGLSELECFHAQAICKNLAICMRPYINRDLAYIKKNYSW